MTSPFDLPFLQAVQPRESCRRKHGRRLQGALGSSLGPVLDLSAGGARLLCPRRFDGERRMTLRPANGENLHLKVVIVWTRRLGFRRFETGVRFLDLDDESAKRVRDIANVHAILDDGVI